MSDENLDKKQERISIFRLGCRNPLVLDDAEGMAARLESPIYWVPEAMQGHSQSQSSCAEQRDILFEEPRQGYPSLLPAKPTTRDIISQRYD